jgi:hypothetical protein
VSVAITAGTYAITSSSITSFDNACFNGGTTQTLVGNKDEGLTGVLQPPAGFTLFGAAVGNFKVSTNGFITFNTALTDPTFENFPLNDSGPDQQIAPFWDDLDNVTICTKSVNGKSVIQWVGQDFSFPTPRLVQFQAILDPSDDSIELVYGPQHSLNGVGDFDFGATVGIESLDGSQSVELGFDLPVVTSSLSIKLTPN